MTTKTTVFCCLLYYENIFLLKTDKPFLINSQTKLYFHFFADADVILEHFYTNTLLVIPAENRTLNKSYTGVRDQELLFLQKLSGTGYRVRKEVRTRQISRSHRDLGHTGCLTLFNSPHHPSPTSPE